MERSRLAVLGSPIAHSLSPALQRAAYRVLGLNWDYDAVELSGAELPEFVRSRDDTWRGLSLTMPLKRDILPVLDTRSELVRETGSANTVLFSESGVHGFNTDVYGLTEGFRRNGTSRLGTVLLLGAGATASSALVSARLLGARRVFVGVRSPERAAGLAELARAQGVEVLVRSLESLVQIDEPLDAVISTLPNGVGVEVALDPDVIRESVLFDVAYSPWPTPLAANWGGVRVIGGLEMLTLQALAQVRIFLNGDPDATLPDEPAVLGAMLAAVGL